MTEKLPTVTAAEVIRALKKAGFPLLGKAEATRSTKTKQGKEQLSPTTLAKSFTLRS